MEILCIGLNHETAPVSVRERMAIGAESQGKALQWIKGQPGIEEIVILSTCNRVEFYFLAQGRSSQWDTTIKELFQHNFGLQADLWEPFLYQYSGQKAVAHLFSVTSGMDSMVVGEPQITGQVKEAYRQAVDHKTVGTILNRLLHKSFSVCKRVRTETELATRAVSVSYVAVELAKKIFGELDNRTALLAGAGEMAELAATHLVSNGIGRVFIASRTLANAQELAKTIRGDAIPFASILDHLRKIDILICSTAAPNYILRAEQIREALRARKHQPVFIIDIAVPRNIDPMANELKNVYLYNMDDLQKVMQANMAERKKELKRAEGIVREEVDEFFRWLYSLDLVPTITSLRKRADEIRTQELNKAISILKGDVSEQQKQVLEAMSQACMTFWRSSIL